MVCTSVGKISREILFRLLENEDLIEIRLDLIKIPIDEILDLIKNRKAKVLITFRTGSIDDITILQTLKTFADLKVDFIDIEIGWTYFDEMVHYCHKLKIIPVISYHNYSNVPEKKFLLNIYHKFSHEGFVKIAVTPNRSDDLKIIRDVRVECKNLTIFGMGDFGEITRVESYLENTPFSFVKSDYSNETASGQLTKIELITRANEYINLYGVIGNPIAHSRSPEIYNYYFSHFNINSHYTRLCSDNGNLPLALIRDLNLKGFNITAPYKEDVYDLCKDLSSDAKACEAVNTVKFFNSYWSGENSDPFGVIKSLQDLNIDFSFSKILILGAGGAAKAAAYALKNHQTSVINRTNEKASDLSIKFNLKFIKFKDLDLAIKNHDIIINTVTKNDLIKSDLIDSKHIIFDASYTSGVLKQMCDAKNAIYISGLPWLINQAKKAFSFFSEKPFKEIPSYHFIDIQKKHICLIGFMGAGKTSVGKKLSILSGLKFIDLDEVIETETGNSIPEIFNTQGEDVFREIETSILNKILESDEKLIISCGGGIVKSKRNRAILRTCYNIWIYSKPETCIKRIENSKRPLSKKNVISLYYQRLPLYAKTSDLIINNNEIENTAQHLYSELQSAKIL
ncbi:MAG: type I 3-dehydroquinate dehydratase [Candidatus Delongbacteria bacterium]|nr:type I 3-dehydroquinate dehydratase [Candidatus Delongbacteria bacterium]MBN2833515.1 type I 3-dehydroquinate dehydratase [Candidatus Delongbacteria bacterium]